MIPPFLQEPQSGICCRFGQISVLTLEVVLIIPDYFLPSIGYTKASLSFHSCFTEFLFFSQFYTICIRTEPSESSDLLPRQEVRLHCRTDRSRTQDQHNPHTIRNITEHAHSRRANFSYLRIWHPGNSLCHPRKAKTTDHPDCPDNPAGSLSKTQDQCAAHTAHGRK